MKLNSEIFFKIFQEVKRGAPIRRLEAWIHEGIASGVDETDALILLDQRPDGYRMGELAKDLHCDPPNAARTARFLVQKGYAVRSRSTEDARGVTIKITPKGLSISRVLRHRRDVISKALFSQLSPRQKKVMFDSLEVFAAAQRVLADQLMTGKLAVDALEIKAGPARKRRKAKRA